MPPRTTTTAAESYDASAITVLEGLDPVRKRPGMYIGSTGTTGLHHCVWEVVDNAVDEAMAGHCTKIEVTLLADGGCRVADNGRGIPVDKHPQYKNKSAAEVVLTTLHAGGKFGGGGYKVSGGLHGVGVSVVNALSTRLDLEIHRDATKYVQTFKAEKSGRTVKAGVPQGPLKKDGTVAKNRTGTIVTFWPDPDVFDDVNFRASTITERLQVTAYLNKGLELVFTDERPGHEQRQVFKADGGIVDMVKHLNATKEPLFKSTGSFSASGPEGEVDVAWQWNGGYHESLFTYANGISTIEGGMHAEGFKRALTQVINRYAKQSGLRKEKDAAFAGEDVREGLCAVVSVRLADPQFEGQTKGKLGNTEIRSLVERCTNENFGRWLEEHPNEGKAIVTKSTTASRARTAAKAAKELTRRKTALEGAGMPDKLADCSSRQREETELYLVEGNSAGGTCKEARDPKTQAVLPLRGKVLNVERAAIDKILKNAEIQSIVAALGAGIGADFDLSKARYDKVVILADADVDGAHIRTLLITFFYRQMTPLVEAGRLYVAQPPLFSTEIDGKKVYVTDEAARQELIEANSRRNLSFARFKGLGEMDPGELRETAMDRATRTLVRIDPDQAAIADEILGILMGDDVEARKHFIQQNAKDVRFLDV
ncbi:MAG: DNA gyrase/topoisomerase IV subunit B [Acidimicrobiia bacterium]